MSDTAESDTIRSHISTTPGSFDALRKAVGLIAGPLLMALLWFLPPGPLGTEAHRLLAILGLVVVFWITEALPLPVTGLLGAALCVTAGVASAKQVMAPFAHPLIFLFLGSFLIVRAMEIHGVDRKIARFILSSAWVGGHPLRLIAAFGFVSFFLSMWLSNSATCAMMMPVALSLLRDQQLDPSRKVHATSTVLLLVAYCCTLGGLGTPIGSPPNLIGIGMLEEQASIRISFFEWVMCILPVGVVLLAGVFLLLLPSLRGVFGARTGSSSEAGPAETLGLTRAQKNVLAAFGTTAFLWIAPGVLCLVLGKAHPVSETLRARIPEAAAALIGASLLFLLPVDWKRREFTVTWNQASRISWGTLLLFGGGLTLGQQMFQTGLAERLGDLLLSSMPDPPEILLIAVFVFIGVFMTELVSNTATAGILVPIAIAVSSQAGVPPLGPALGVTVSCSLAFMLPVATPPNAIVYGTERVPLTRMIRWGFWMNLVGLAITTIAIFTVARILR